VKTSTNDNNNCTNREFIEKWLPYHARKKKFSPDSYDNYRSNLDNHILPHFGNKVMNLITSEDIDDFLDLLSRKPCRGSKSYGKSPKKVPVLASASIKKCYTILTAGFGDAKKWGYMREIPSTTPPTEKTKKRRFWNPERIHTVLDTIQEDTLLHLAVHMGFVCSLRAGEVAGIDWNTIDFQDGSLWLTQQVQRVSDEALSVLSKEDVIRVFPKQVSTGKSSLILKSLKTEGSHRKQYLTMPLMKEIQERIAELEEQKAFSQEEYHNYGLLFCQPDGRPLDPKSLNKAFKEGQRSMGIDEQDQIEFQGLRKSGQMHKVRISQNNYQLVAESAGQSAEVLMNNYNEALDSEKRALSRMVESSFYSQSEIESSKDEDDLIAVLTKIQQNPDLSRQLLQRLLLGAVDAGQNNLCKDC
jgi:Integrase